MEGAQRARRQGWRRQASGRLPATLRPAGEMGDQTRNTLGMKPRKFCAVFSYNQNLWIVIRTNLIYRSRRPPASTRSARVRSGASWRWAPRTGLSSSTALNPPSYSRSARSTRKVLLGLRRQIERSPCFQAVLIMYSNFTSFISFAWSSTV